MKIIIFILFYFSTVFSGGRQLYYIGSFENKSLLNCKIYPIDYGKNDTEILNLLSADIVKSYKLVDKNFKQIDGYCNVETPISTKQLYALASKNYNVAVLSLTILPTLNARNAVASEEFGIEFIEPFVFNNTNKKTIKRIDSNKQLASILADRLYILFQDERSNNNCMNQETGLINKTNAYKNIKIIKDIGFVETAKLLSKIIEK